MFENVGIHIFILNLLVKGR